MINDKEILTHDMIKPKTTRLKSESYNQLTLSMMLSNLCPWVYYVETDFNPNS